MTKAKTTKVVRGKDQAIYCPISSRVCEERCRLWEDENGICLVERFLKTNCKS